MATEKKDAGTIEKAKTLSHVPWCDEYEKMISGMVYNICDAGLAQARFRARRLTNKYHTHFPDDATPSSLEQDRRAMLQGVMGKIGAGSRIEPPLQVDYGSNIRIGCDVYANFHLVILDSALVTIGDGVLMGPSVSIFAVVHDVDVASRRRGVMYANPLILVMIVGLAGM